MQQDAHKRALIAGSIGNFIEWYEFAVYGFLATVIARNFFQLEGEAELTIPPRPGWIWRWHSRR